MDDTIECFVAGLMNTNLSTESVRKAVNNY